MSFIRPLVAVLLAFQTSLMAVDVNQDKECPKGDAAAFRYTHADADLAQMKGFLGVTPHGYPKVTKALRTAIQDQWSIPCDEVNVKDATQYRRLSKTFINQFNITETGESYNVIFQTHSGDVLNQPGQRFLAYWEIMENGKMRLLFNRDAEFDEEKLQKVFRAIRQNGGLLRKEVIVTEAVR